MRILSSSQYHNVTYSAKFEATIRSIYVTTLLGVETLEASASVTDIQSARAIWYRLVHASSFDFNLDAPDSLLTTLLYTSTHSSPVR